MARVVLQPPSLDIGLFRDQYDALTQDLEAAGYDVRIVREVEERGAGSQVGEAVFNLAVHVLDDAEDAAVGAIVALMVARLRGTIRGRRRRVQVLWGPHGEKLRDDELPEE
jgi:hypothetical protein